MLEISYEFILSKPFSYLQRFTSSFCWQVYPSLRREFTPVTPEISMGSMFCLIRLRQIADTISYMTMMNGFEITGDWQQALQLLHHVQQQKLEAD